MNFHLQFPLGFLPSRVLEENFGISDISLLCDVCPFCHKTNIIKAPHGTQSTDLASRFLHPPLGSCWKGRCSPYGSYLMSSTITDKYSVDNVYLS